VPAILSKQASKQKHASFRLSASGLTILLLALAAACASSSHQFGSVELLPGDPPPPDLPPDHQLLDLGDDRSSVCLWIENLPRPSRDECTGGVHSADDSFYIGIDTAAEFCRSTLPHRTPDCHVTLEALVGCAVDTSDCSTTIATPQRCEIMRREECHFDFFGVPEAQ
jgi:hypothetical protein